MRGYAISKEEGENLIKLLKLFIQFKVTPLPTIFIRYKFQIFSMLYFSFSETR